MICINGLRPHDVLRIHSSWAKPDALSGKEQIKDKVMRQEMEEERPDDQLLGLASLVVRL